MQKYGMRCITSLHSRPKAFELLSARIERDTVPHSQSNDPVDRKSFRRAVPADSRALPRIARTADRPDLINILSPR